MRREDRRLDDRGAERTGPDDATPGIRDVIGRQERPVARSRGQAEHLYTAYGFTVRSEVPLPELAPLPPEAAGDAERGPDLAIRRARLGLAAAEGSAVSFAFGAEGTEMWWREVGGFRIAADGTLIEVDAAPGVGDDLLAFPLLGPVLAMALHRRRMFLLHASAVSVDGAGVVLMGDKGAGKSTTATALLAAGHRLVADDIAAFHPATGRLLPAFPQVKLSDEALSRLRQCETTVRPPVHDAIDKHRVLIPGHFAAAPVPVMRIFVIERGAELAVLPCDRAAALRHLLRFAYMARFGGRAMDRAETARHFSRAAGLADGGTVRRLVLPHGLDRLPEAVERIRAEVAGAAGAAAPRGAGG